MKKTVVVGLSGGVDSSVAAYLLKEQGYHVIGLFMRNWNDASVTLEDQCPWIEDSTDALLVAHTLDIPFQVIDLSTPYKERVVDYMFDAYKKGRTPNPDVLCNRDIKFDLFLNTALELGADFVATGHYCQKEIVKKSGKVFYNLRAGTDKNKDQSYFLCQLSQMQLAHALFPIGHLQKSQVREIAKKLNLVTAEKKDSQGLCFVGKVDLPTFLQQKLKPKKGRIIEIPAALALQNHLCDDDLFNKQPTNQKEDYWTHYVAAKTYTADIGTFMGWHSGAHYFTIGQRKGLKVGGTSEPLFVIATDVKENIVYVGRGKQHPGLYRKALFIKPEEIHWIRGDMALKTGESMQIQARIRYRQALVCAKLYRKESGLYLVFQQAQAAVTPGQFAAWYIGDVLVGSGVIS